MAPFTQTLHWTSVALLLVVGVGLWRYLAAWRALRDDGHEGSATGRRLGLFIAGLLTLLVAAAGPLDWLGEKRLMSAHMLQHILVMSVAPALLVGGCPPVLLERLARLLGDPGRRGPTTAVCLLAGVGGVWTLHSPPVLDAGLASPTLHDAQHLVLFVAGLLVVWPLMAPGRLRGMAAVAYLAVAELGIGVLGLWLAWYPEVVYAVYGHAPRLWGLSAETDQALAGALLLVLGEPFLAIEVAVLFMRALGDPDDESGRDQEHADTVVGEVLAGPRGDD